MPLYENEQTLEKELKAQRVIETALKVHYEKLPIHYGMDFAAMNEDGYITHWAELKCRDFNHDKYRTYVLSFEKILKARELSQATSLESLLFLSFNDGVVLRTRIDNVKDWSPYWGGRTKKTRRSADIHPAVRIRADWFDRIV